MATALPRRSWAQRVLMASLLITVVAAMGLATVSGLYRVDPVPDTVGVPVPFLMAVEVPTLALSTDSAKAAQPLHFSFAVGEQNYLQLADASAVVFADEALKKRANLVSGDGGYFVSAFLDLSGDEIPLHIKSWLGRNIVLDERCTATVEKIRVVARLFGDDGYHAVDLDIADKAVGVFAAGAKVYAGTLSGCTEKYSYGRDAAKDKPPFAQRLKLGDEARPAVEAAKRHIRTTAPAIGAQQRWLAARKDNKEHWLSQATFTSTAFTSDQGSVLVMSVTSGEYCSEFSAALWAVYEIKEHGGIDDPYVELGQLISVNIGYIEPLAAIAHRDHRMVLIANSETTDRTMYSRTGQIIDASTIPYYGCRC